MSQTRAVEGDGQLECCLNSSACRDSGTNIFVYYCVLFISFSFMMSVGGGGLTV